MNAEVLTIKGEKFAILPLNIYEKLLEAIEDVQDIADAKEIEAQVKRGEMECFPAYILDEIIDEGKNAVKVYREYRGLTQNELAEKANISLAMIRKIESGQSEGSVSTIKAIAAALNLDVDLLI